MTEHYVIRLPRCRTEISTLTLVDANAANDRLSAVERCARYFRRETHFDFPPYVAEQAKGNPEIEGWLLPLNSRGPGSTYAAGGAGFSHRSDLPETPWMLAWVWAHPYVRHRGIVTSAWEMADSLRT